MPKPRVIDPGDVILRVTGSAICGSDLHLYHGTSETSVAEHLSLTWTGSIIQLQKGDVLGHEFCGVVESAGPDATKVKPGDRVVAGFPICCGECTYCKKGLTSSCERTNDNSIINAMYGKRSAGTRPSCG
jgi:threonine dehydrogenase-like Zn-dependent dehydrogenase